MKYMHGKRLLRDGTYREGDNWQNGFGFLILMESLSRHYLDLELLHKGYAVYEVVDEFNDGDISVRTEVFFQEPDDVPENWHKKTIEDTLNAIRFNSEAYKLEYLKEKHEKKK